MAPAQLSASAEFPLEIYYELIDYHRSDVPTLRSWASTCRTLLPYARSYLFRAVLLDCTDFDQVHLFARLLDSNASIGPFVDSLTITQPTKWFGGPDPSFKSFMLPWDQLSSLRTLQTKFLILSSMDDLFAILECLPSLEQFLYVAAT